MISTNNGRANNTALLSTLGIAGGFLVVTLILILLQPGPPGDAVTRLPADAAVTRTDGNPLYAVAPVPTTAMDGSAQVDQNQTEQEQAAVSHATRAAPVTDTPTVPLANAVAQALGKPIPTPNATQDVAAIEAGILPRPTSKLVDPLAASEPSDMREATWNVLRALDAATGRSSSPGRPGSLLHTIVSRAVTDGTPETDTADTSYLQALLSEAGAMPRIVTPPTDGTTYRVRPGDTLQSIALKFYGDSRFFETIFKANKHQLSRADALRSGQVLALPGT